MALKKIETRNALYPSLTTVVGLEVGGRPNFLTIAHVGILNHGSPQYLSFGIHKSHYSNQGIAANGEFSVNIPSEGQVAETDYVGLVTGKNTDKSGVFEIFRGELEHAPMIADCPVAMEMRLVQTLSLGEHDIFVGEIAATWARPEVLSDKGKIDPLKVKPLLFDMGLINYHSLGPAVAKCWNVGKRLK